MRRREGFSLPVTRDSGQDGDGLDGNYGMRGMAGLEAQVQQWLFLRHVRVAGDRALTENLESGSLIKVVPNQGQGCLHLYHFQSLDQKENVALAILQQQVCYVCNQNWDRVCS